jgi:NAD(P)-dependent dehydrogenase (short-subunit alcohol dehydrogenase family)
VNTTKSGLLVSKEYVKVPDETSPTSLFDVSDKVVVITGASRGIGRALAEGFIRAGARVYVCARRMGLDWDTADLGGPGSCVVMTANLGSVAGCKDFAAQIADRETAIDVLINNAGTIWVESLEGYSETGWDKVFDLNVKAPFYLIQALLPMLRAAAKPESPARVINIGSVGGFRIPDRETYAYSASKAALHHLTRHLAASLAPMSITANVIAPGRFGNIKLQNFIDAEGDESLLAPIPLGRFVEPDDLVGAAIYLASKAGAGVTGAVLPVDGGFATTV